LRPYRKQQRRTNPSKARNCSRDDPFWFLATVFLAAYHSFCTINAASLDFAPADSSLCDHTAQTATKNKPFASTTTSCSNCSRDAPFWFLANVFLAAYSFFAINQQTNLSISP
jgi:hypothetical protein